MPFNHIDPFGHCIVGLVALANFAIPIHLDNRERISKVLIYSGMLVQAGGIWAVLFSGSTLGWIAGMSLLGVGTALVYPTLLAAISDIAHPKWRATSLGVYRFWRDLGLVFGALGVGFLADLFGATLAIQTVAWIAVASGIFVIVFMKETISKTPKPA